MEDDIVALLFGAFNPKAVEPKPTKVSMRESDMQSESGTDRPDSDADSRKPSGAVQPTPDPSLEGDDFLFGGGAPVTQKLAPGFKFAKRTENTARAVTERVVSSMARQDGGASQRPSVDKDKVKSLIEDNPAAFYQHLLGHTPRRVADNYMFKCPFHDDDHASLGVSKVNGLWNCYTGCGGGDGILMWMKIRSQDFVSALKSINEFYSEAAWKLDNGPKVGNGRRPKAQAENSKVVAIAITDGTVLEDVQRAAELLQSNPRVLDRLLNRYGILPSTLRELQIGWSSKRARLSIPIFHDGKLVNVRYHDVMRVHCLWKSKDDNDKIVYTDVPHGMSEDDFIPIYDAAACRPTKQGTKVLGVKGHNSVTLYPSSSLALYASANKDKDSGERIVVTGGELKAVYLNQQGVPAVTFTGGEGTFSREWIESFRGLNIEVCLDADEAGKRGAEKLAAALAEVAERVDIIDLPHSDVNDYYRFKKWEFNDWNDLPRRNVGYGNKEDFEDVGFKEVRNPNFYNKFLRFRALLAGTGETPYFIAKSCSITCARGQHSPKPLCKDCGLPGRGFAADITITPEDIVEIKGFTPQKQSSYIARKIVSIPSNCFEADVKIKVEKVEHIGIVADLENEFTTEDAEAKLNFVHHAYLLGASEVRENEPHIFECKSVQDPRDSTATLVVTKAVPVKRVHEGFEVSREVDGKLRAFVDNESYGSVANHIGEFLPSEIAEGYAGIYGQPELAMGIMLTMFAPMSITMDGHRNEKVCPECLIIGDSRCGKSSLAKAMIRHFKAGRFIPCEGATYAGLVGGADSVGAKKFFTWGAIPTQDGGAVFLDEIDDIIKRDVFAQLTSIRSDGAASRIISGGARQAKSRVRMVMMTNPAGSRKMSSYTSVMYAVQELIHSPQDIARFDYVIGVQRDDNPGIYNRKRRDTPLIYTSEIAQEHIRWAWRQAPRIKMATTEAIMNVATSLSNEFKGLILLSSSEARWKVARVASAIAALSYSTADDGTLEVKPSHVEVADTFFRMLYASDKFGFKQFSGRDAKATEELSAYLKKLGTKVVDYLFYNTVITTDVIDTLCSSVSSRNEFLRILTVDNPCLVKKRHGYYKSESFIAILEGIKTS